MFGAAMAVQRVQRRTMGSRRGFGCGHARLAPGTAEGVNTVVTVYAGTSCVRVACVSCWAPGDAPRGVGVY